MKIVALTKDNIKKASNIANKIFYYEDILPEKFFKASFKPKEFNKLLNIQQKIETCKYYVAINEKKEVIGTTGLYSIEDDEKNKYWLGWFCVNQKYRGQGIGQKLLDFTINKAKKKGAKYLNLYTSTNPLEENAQKLYKKNKFYKINKKETQIGPHKTIYLRKKLI